VAEQFDRIIARPRFTIRHLATDETAFEPHAHAAYAVATVLAGSLAVVVGGRTATLAAGESALITVGEAHSAHARRAELLSVHVQPVALDELLAELGWQHPAAYPVFRAPVATDPTLSALARQLGDELAGERPGQSMMLDALVQQLAVHLLRAHLRVRRAPTIERTRFGPVDRRLRRAIELMHAHADEEIGLAELAEAASLSPSHFAHLFKDLVGLTPHGYLTNLRIERARALLVETELPITEIAARVGFRSPGYFATIFKAVAGISPRAYRTGAVDRWADALTRKKRSGPHEIAGS